MAQSTTILYSSIASAKLFLYQGPLKVIRALITLATGNSEYPWALSHRSVGTDPPYAAMCATVPPFCIDGRQIYTTSPLESDSSDHSSGQHVCIH